MHPPQLSLLRRLHDILSVTKFEAVPALVARWSTRPVVIGQTDMSSPHFALPYTVRLLWLVGSHMFTDEALMRLCVNAACMACMLCTYSRSDLRARWCTAQVQNTFCTSGVIQAVIQKAKKPGKRQPHVDLSFSQCCSDGKPHQFCYKPKHAFWSHEIFGCTMSFYQRNAI